jgi:outer membrane receptor protein involved in Fe transport
VCRDNHPDGNGTMNARRGVRALMVLLAGLAAGVPTAHAQEQPGRITGRVVDGATGRGLSGARVSVQGTALAVPAGVDGRYTLARVPAGTYTLSVSMLGYGTKAVTGLSVAPGAAAQMDVSLLPAAVTLQGISVSAARERGTVSRALDEQRTATGIVNATTAEQIARSPDVNAAQAVQRVSGVSVQGGKYVVVRGLGERYTTTSLNGARLPSPESDRRVVPLDLFPAGLLESVSTTKTFTPDQPGDFSGARVDLRTREFPTRRVLTFTAGSGYNDVATGRSVLAAPTSGGEWLGFAGSGRALPGAVRAGGEFRNVPQPLVNQAVRSFRNVWSPIQGTAAPNGSLGFSLGGQDPLFGKQVGYALAGSYNSGFEYHDGETRALAVGNPARAINQFAGQTGTRSVLWGGVGNLSVQLGAFHRISLNNLYDRTADNEAHSDLSADLYGYEYPVRRSWVSFVERTVRSNQLQGRHTVAGRDQLTWQVTSSHVSRNEPDRTDVLWVSDAEGHYSLETLTGAGVRRSYSTLGEANWTGGADWRMEMGPQGRSTTLKVGGESRRTRRDVDLRTYGLGARGLTAAQSSLPPEQLFAGPLSDADSDAFFISNNSAGGRYDARDRVAAGYLMLEQPLGERVRLVGGARVESWKLGIDARRVNAATDTTYDFASTDVLPSLAMNVELTDFQNLRLSASQTLSRPEYRELVPFLQTNPVGDLDFVGNADLRRALVRNLDVRWELYPGSGEVLSVALFGKKFVRPIEQIQLATSGGNVLSYVNTQGATNYGVELEARKSLGFLPGALGNLGVFGNATFMRSRIEVGNDSISALTNAVRPMQGQAPYVVNAGAGYTGGRTTATVLYNVVGRRISQLGLNPAPDTYVQPRHVLDFSLQQKLTSAFALKLNARNLLDAPYRETAGPVTRLEYRTGRVYSVQASWSPATR